MSGKGIECYNTRVFKTTNEKGKVEYEIRLASEEIGELLRESNSEGHVFVLKKGDYSPLMGATARFVTIYWPLKLTVLLYIIDLY